MHQKPVKVHPSTFNAGISPGQRRFLYLTAAVTGMVIMIIEILGARMLAPYVGTSHYVWTAQIVVTLIALAVGYYAGGWLADRTQKLSRLYAAIVIAATYLCFTVLIIKPVANWCLDFRLALGSLLASSTLFFPPLALLAMVGPFFVRALTHSVNDVGRHVGWVISVGTLGSVVGTILIGYVLIPLLPNSIIMLLSAGLLFVVALLYFAVWRSARIALAPILLALASGSAMGYFGLNAEQPVNTARFETRFKGNSNFGQLEILDSRDGAATTRYYLNDLLVQDVYDFAHKQSAGNFTYLLHGLARGYNPRIKNVLCIGMGVGIVPAEFQREGAAVDVVEINPAVIPLAKRYFDCPVEQLNLTIGDGRQYLRHCRSHLYDAVILDAFLGESCPSHLMTREAFNAIRDVLRPDGVLVINTFGKLEQGKDFLPASLYKTLRSVFRNVRMHPAGTGAMFFAASDQAELKPFDYPDPGSIHQNCRAIVENAISDVCEPDPRSGIILTDDYNPAEVYDAHNREEIRRELARFELNRQKLSSAAR